MTRSEVDVLIRSQQMGEVAKIKKKSNETQVASSCKTQRRVISVTVTRHRTNCELLTL